MFRLFGMYLTPSPSKKATTQRVAKKDDGLLLGRMKLLHIRMYIVSKDQNLSLFALYVITSVQFAGRTTETAKGVFNNIKMEHPPSSPTRKRILARPFYLRSSLDWYFLLGYAMIMNDTGAGREEVFPEY
jgi:hypothetical protein